MSIFIKNRTDKEIVYTEVQLIFPDLGEGSEARARSPSVGSVTSTGNNMSDYRTYRGVRLKLG